MQFISKVALMAFAVGQFASAHSGVTRFFVDGVDQGVGVAYRMNPDGSTFSFPVQNLASTDMACGFSGTKGVSRVAEANDGSTLTFQWNDYPNDPSHGVIDPSHHGPCAVYMKKVESAINDPGAGDGWFKIWDDGYDEVAQTWCTNKLINANGLMTVQLPEGLVGGYYLVRPELLTLNNAATGDPQFYLGCAQVFLKSTGTKVPVNTVAIPGYVRAGEPAVNLNIWTPLIKLPYPIPGPAVATFEDSGSTTQTIQTEGIKPDTCIVENGNWCGVEVPAYATERGCWASADYCWKQGKTCWDTAGPTGGDGCVLWQAKCKDLNNQCTAGNFDGPPNAGKDLMPPHSSISPPPPLAPTMIGASVVAAVGTNSVSPVSVSNLAKYSAATPVPSAPVLETSALLVGEAPISYAAASPAVSAAPSVDVMPEASASDNYLPACESPEEPSEAMSAESTQTPPLILEHSPANNKCGPATFTVTATDDVTVTTTVTSTPAAETVDTSDAKESESAALAAQTKAADLKAPHSTKAKRTKRRRAKLTRRLAHPSDVAFQSAVTFQYGVARPTGFMRVPKASAA